MRLGEQSEVCSDLPAESGVSWGFMSRYQVPQQNQVVRRGQLDVALRGSDESDGDSHFSGCICRHLTLMTSCCLKRHDPAQTPQPDYGGIDRVSEAASLQYLGQLPSLVPDDGVCGWDEGLGHLMGLQRRYALHD